MASGQKATTLRARGKPRNVPTTQNAFIHLDANYYRTTGSAAGTGQRFNIQKRIANAIGVQSAEFVDSVALSTKRIAITSGELVNRVMLTAKQISATQGETVALLTAKISGAASNLKTILIASPTAINLAKQIAK